MCWGREPGDVAGGANELRGTDRAHSRDLKTATFPTPRQPMGLGVACPGSIWRFARMTYLDLSHLSGHGRSAVTAWMAVSAWEAVEPFSP
jgi:hypothetical protein